MAGNTDERVKTGIYGFEDLSLGGIPKNRCTLIKGDIGTGKTVFSIEYIYRGISLFNENGVYVSFEESPEQIKKNAKNFGWDLQKLEDEGKLKIIDARNVWITIIEDASTESGLGHLLNRIKKEAKTINAKRIVIDTMYGMFVESKFIILIRRELHKIINELDGMGCTSVLTIGSVDNITTSGATYSEIVEALVDCVIVLKEKGLNVLSERKIKILKMRGYDYINGFHPVIITSRGIAVFPLITKLDKIPDKKGIKTKEETYIDSPKFMRSLSEKIPRGYNILIVGEIGTNASNFARQILYDGLVKGESCLLVNTHEPSGIVKKFMENFGMNVEKYVKNDKMFFFDDYVKSQNDEKIIIDSFDNPLILGYLMDKWLMDNSPGNFRWAINSITTIIAMNEPQECSSTNMQRFLYDKLRKTRKFGGIGIYTINKDSHSPKLINTIENMMDMVIELKTIEEKGDQHCYLRLLKARGVVANTSWHQYTMVKDEGIVMPSDVYPFLKKIR